MIRTNQRQLYRTLLQVYSLVMQCIVLATNLTQSLHLFASFNEAGSKFYSLSTGKNAIIHCR